MNKITVVHKKKPVDIDLTVSGVHKFNAPREMLNNFLFRQCMLANVYHTYCIGFLKIIATHVINCRLFIIYFWTKLESGSRLTKPSFRKLSSTTFRTLLVSSSGKVRNFNMMCNNYFRIYYTITFFCS